MARRRYLSTDISTDPVVDQLSAEAGDFAALLYTWMIPHADDDGTLPGDPKALLLKVVPGRLRDKTPDDIASALDAMDRLGLIAWVRTDHRPRIEFPWDAFYRYQTYIRPERRRPKSAATRAAQNAANQRKAPQNTAEHRTSAQNAASLSLSHSVSVRGSHGAIPRAVPSPGTSTALPGTPVTGEGNPPRPPPPKPWERLFRKPTLRKHGPTKLGDVYADLMGGRSE